MPIVLPDEPPTQWNDISGQFYGFRIKFWEQMGFRFRDKYRYDGKQTKTGSACFGSYSFTLMISNISIAGVRNEETNHEERHAVYEDDAIEWFSRLSCEFCDKSKIVGI